jgi:hypothetical protein
VATEVGGLLSPAALAHPAFDPLRPWLGQLEGGPGGRPGLARLNALAGTSARPPRSPAGHPIRFCPPDRPGAGHYEQRIHDTGEVATRPDNLHDLFNALAWLAFPRTKAALNARHVAQLPTDGPLRGPLRDLLTLFDEGGVIVACTPDACAEVESMVRAFRWQVLFWEYRDALLRDARFVLVGHSAYEKALTPYPGITCKALFLPAPRALLDGPLPALVDWLDSEAASWLGTLPEGASPRQMAPLPVFGYPGWLAEASHPGFYADRRWFRAGRGTSGGVDSPKGLSPGPSSV